MNYEKRVMIQAFNILTKKDFEWTDIKIDGYKNHKRIKAQMVA